MNYSGRSAKLPTTPRISWVVERVHEHAFDPMWMVVVIERSNRYRRPGARFFRRIGQHAGRTRSVVGMPEIE
jgi:hypothetical protein